MPEPTQAARSSGSSKPMGIGGRMALLVCAAVALTGLAGGTWTYAHLSRGLVDQEFSWQRGAIETAAAQLTNGIDALTRDAAFLADVPAIQGMARSVAAGGVDPVEKVSENLWKQRLISIFEAKLRTAPPYLQIRLISNVNGGREVVRVERHGARIVAAGEDQLQSKVDLRDFQEAIRLPDGGVYLSDIELTKESDPTTPRPLPELHAASPVYLSDGRLFGIVVIDKDLRSRFATMRDTLAGHYDLFVFDESGQVRMDAGPSGTHVTPLTPLLGDRFGGLAGMIANPDRSSGVVSDRSSGARLVATVRLWHYDPDRPDRYLGLLLTSNYASVTAPSVTESRRSIWFGLLLLAVTVGTVLAASRKITRPLREITQAVEDFGQGKTELSLPAESGDEAGTLTRAFRRMAGQVRQQQAALEAEVAERRHAEESLREGEQQLRLALDAAQAGIWVLDPCTNTNVWDERLEAMFGLTPNSFAGTFEAWAELVHPQDREQAVGRARLALDNEQLYEGEFRAGRRGAWRHIKSRGIVLRDSAGRAVKMIGVCWDVTASRLAQQRIRETTAELEHKNQEMEQFVYSVSHDLKSPLVTCKGFMGILNEELAAGNIPQAIEAAQRVRQATRRMATLIEDLLQLSRVGRVSGEAKTLDITALASELIAEMSGEYDPHRLRIEVQPGLPTLAADPTAITRLLQNLLGNAFKYGCGAEQPRIEVGGFCRGEEVHYFVRDNGAGIAQQYQKKIFGVFQRLDNTQDGTGIGLAIVTRIMDAHGGRTWVESEPGQGATFWLAFPQRYLATVEEPLAVT